MVCAIFAYTVQFLSYACQKRRKKKEERKKERKKMNKIDFFAFGFLDLVKG